MSNHDIITAFESDKAAHIRAVKALAGRMAEASLYPVNMVEGEARCLLEGFEYVLRDWYGIEHPAKRLP